MEDRSPFPWVSDEAWARRASDLEISVEPADVDRAIQELELCVANESDRQRAPIAPLISEAAVPPPIDDIADAKRLLCRAVCLGLLFPSAFCWVVCCDRLTTLLSTCGHPMPGAPAHFTEHEIRQQWGVEHDELPRLFAQLDGAPPSHYPWWRRVLGPKQWIESYRQMQIQGHAGSDSTHILQCRNCGRVYLASHHS